MPSDGERPVSLFKFIRHFSLLLIVLFMRTIFPKSHTLEVTRIRLKSKKLDPSISTPFKVIHISDIHYDVPPYVPRIFPELLEEVIKHTNAEHPDIVCITGDFVQARARAVHELVDKYLTRLQPRKGIYACLGNHDYKENLVGRDLIMKELNTNGVHVLMNESVNIEEPGRQSVQIVGLGDHYYKPDFRPDLAFPADEAVESERFRLVLSHNPDTANYLRQYDIDLQLSGHTHGGQVHLPFGLGPLIPWIKAFVGLLFLKPLRKKLPGYGYLSVVDKWEWAVGLHKVEKSFEENVIGYNQLYTSRGLATHPPFRLFCPPELTIFEIVPESDE